MSLASQIADVITAIGTELKAKADKGAIVDADVDASAAIALSKLATGHLAGFGTSGSAQTLNVRLLADEAAYDGLGFTDSSTIYVWPES